MRNVRSVNGDSKSPVSSPRPLVWAQMLPNGRHSGNFLSSAAGPTRLFRPSVTTWIWLCSEWIPRRSLVVQALHCHHRVDHVPEKSKNFPWQTQPTGDDHDWKTVCIALRFWACEFKIRINFTHCHLVYESLEKKSRQYLVFRHPNCSVLSPMLACSTYTFLLDNNSETHG